jgi:hypothetical protein
MPTHVQAERRLCVAEAGPSTCERSVMCRNRKFELLPSHAAERMRMLELPLTKSKRSTRDSRIRIRAPGRRGCLGIMKDKNTNGVVYRFGRVLRGLWSRRLGRTVCSWQIPPASSL